MDLAVFEASTDLSPDSAVNVFSPDSVTVGSEDYQTPTGLILGSVCAGF